MSTASSLSSHSTKHLPGGQQHSTQQLSHRDKVSQEISFDLVEVWELLKVLLLARLGSRYPLAGCATLSDKSIQPLQSTSQLHTPKQCRTPNITHCELVSTVLRMLLGLVLSNQHPGMEAHHLHLPQTCCCFCWLNGKGQPSHLLHQQPLREGTRGQEQRVQESSAGAYGMT